MPKKKKPSKAFEKIEAGLNEVLDNVRGLVKKPRSKKVEAFRARMRGPVKTVFEDLGYPEDSGHIRWAIALFEEVTGKHPTHPSQIKAMRSAWAEGFRRGLAHKLRKAKT